jgi:phospholipid/cholesterol/gamma-HCH transport system substrate-binding protein
MSARVTAVTVDGPLGRKVLGIAFLCLLGLAGWLTYAGFTRAFVDVVPVTLRTGRVGLQMQPLAEVKLRGVLVGEVRALAPTPDGGALLRLAMDPDSVRAIPADVTAAILPTSVFGRKYVALQVPQAPSPEPLAAGDVITGTRVPVEVQHAVGNLYPLMRAVRPADLAATLNAAAGALQGRGERLGDALVRLDGYVRRLNPQVPRVAGNLRMLTRVSDRYARAMPDVGRLLRNQTATAGTLLEEEADLRALFTRVTRMSGTTGGLLEVNAHNIIRLVGVSAPTLALLERYSPEYPCLLRSGRTLIPRASQAFRGTALHVNLETVPYQPSGYAPADAPKYHADYGPSCATLPLPPYSQTDPAPVPWWADEREDDDGIAGSHGKYRAVPAYRTDRTDVTTLLLGPLVRGSAVSLTSGPAGP